MPLVLSPYKLRFGTQVPVVEPDFLEYGFQIILQFNAFLGAKTKFL